MPFPWLREALQKLNTQASHDLKHNWNVNVVFLAIFFFGAEEVEMETLSSESQTFVNLVHLKLFETLSLYLPFSEILSHVFVNPCLIEGSQSRNSSHN